MTRGPQRISSPLDSRFCRPFVCLARILFPQQEPSLRLFFLVRFPGTTFFFYSDRCQKTYLSFFEESAVRLHGFVALLSIRDGRRRSVFFPDFESDAPGAPFGRRGGCGSLCKRPRNTRIEGFAGCNILPRLSTGSKRMSLVPFDSII